MTAFTIEEMRRLREGLDAKVRTATLCALMRGHPRDEVIEAIDSLRRSTTVEFAMKRVNHILTLQASGAALINGNPQFSVARTWSRPASGSGQFQRL